MGVMKRAQAEAAREEAADQARRQDRFLSTVVIGACIIAAVRLARADSLSRSSPRLNIAILDSVALARRILDAVLGGRT